jgi:hypothetical protein
VAAAKHRVLRVAGREHEASGHRAGQISSAHAP